MASFSRAAVTPVECLHYALSLPTSTVITGIDSLKILKQDLEVVKTFKPLTAEQVTALLARTAKTASEAGSSRSRPPTV